MYHLIHDVSCKLCVLMVGNIWQKLAKKMVKGDLPDPKMPTHNNYSLSYLKTFEESLTYTGHK